jgi:hypothetical protein
MPAQDMAGTSAGGRSARPRQPRGVVREHFPLTVDGHTAVTRHPHPQTRRMTDHRHISHLAHDGVTVDTLAAATPQSCRSSSSKLQNTTVVSPSTAPSVIVKPNSTVRTIVSATTAAGDDVRSDTRLPDR